MHGKKVLLMEADKEIADLVRFNLARDSYRLAVASDAPTGLAELRRNIPNIIVLDSELPGISPQDACSFIRRDPRTTTLPMIIIVSSRDIANDLSRARYKADEYLVKPFTPAQLMTAIRFLLRRLEQDTEETNPIKFDGLLIDPLSYRVIRNGERVKLSLMEFRLLHFMASKPNTMFTREKLLDAIWGTDRHIGTRSIDVYIRRLRGKIEKDTSNPTYLQTVRGAGYMFESQPT